MMLNLWRISVLPKALVIPEKFQHILRVLNTNIDGKQKIMFAMTAIKVRNSPLFYGGLYLPSDLIN